MASLQAKTRNGRQYWYIMESARVNGKPRVVKQTYLGTTEKLAQLLRGEIGPKAQTRRVKPSKIEDRAYGREMALFNIARRLGLEEIVQGVLGNKQAGAYPIGQMVAAAAIHRACNPGSKQALPKWYRKTSLPSKTGWSIPDDYFSQNWWNNLHDISEQQIDEIQWRVLGRMKSEFNIETNLLLYDPTNFYTFISRHHLHPHRVTLPQHGKNKHKRNDLLQVNLVMVGTADGGIPLFSHTYAGNIPDINIIRELFPGCSEKILAATGDDNHTIVFDRGNVTRECLEMLDGDARFVSTLKPSHFKDLMFIPLDEYTQPELLTSLGNRLKVWKGKVNVYGQERTVVMTFNAASSKREYRTFIERLMRQWKKAKDYIDNEVHSGKTKSVPVVYGRLNKLLLKYHDLTGLVKASVQKEEGRWASWS